MKEKTLFELKNEIHKWAIEKGFWGSYAMGSKPFNLEFTTKIMLIVTELSEAVEACRNSNWKKKHGVDEEIADAMIRLLDICGRYDIDIYSEVEKKMKENYKREHLHGKKF
jgi:NTP pyrophosphatase (non-canonical NTP hydrolase)